MKDKIVKLIATFFYIGNAPFAPGSLASVAGALLCIACYNHPSAFLVLTVFVIVLGFLVSGQMERALGRKDPSCIVIDEVAGVMIAFYHLPPTWPVIITAFFLFRAFDMFKIYPVNKFEPLGGSAGVMLDDLFAGIYTNFTMRLALFLAPVFK